jgi:hypothetical protein
MEATTEIDDDHGRIVIDSIRIPLELAHAFRRLLVELSHGDGDVVIVDNAYGTVKCRTEDVPRARLLWHGFQAGLLARDARVPQLAQAICRQYDVSHAGGTWSLAAIERLIREQLESSGGV